MKIVFIIRYWSNSFDIKHCFSQLHSWESSNRILSFFFLFFFLFLTFLSKGDWQIVGKFADSSVSDMCQEVRRSWRTLGTGLKVRPLFLLVTHRRERHSHPDVPYYNRSNTDRMFLLAGADAGGNRYDFGTQCRVIASRRVLRTRRFPSYHPHDNTASLVKFQR